MNLILTTALALAATAEGRLAVPPGLPSFADQLSFLAEPCVDRGCAPDYCYPFGADPDYSCYKSGYPKCCTKTKGNCPTEEENKPGCECGDADCSGHDTRSERCAKGDGICIGGTFCKAADGECDAGSAGRCEVMPTSCGLNYRPVCGCNGATYDNECLASAVGVGVDYEGECGSPVETSDCTLDGNECGAGEFCAADAGQCLLRMAGIPGKCTPTRPMCTMSYDPVCGCDGETYDNADCAQAQGVNVAAEGACGSPVESDCTLDGNECGSGEFCAADAGQCLLRMAGIPGTCEKTRMACDMSYAPVCGCDGVTYDNADCAAAQGANVAMEGRCELDCTYYGVNDDTCGGSNQFCRIGNGDCTKRIASQEGTCGIKPLMCPYDYRPVCGCDSKTYANECEANYHGVNVMHSGEC